MQPQFHSFFNSLLLCCVLFCGSVNSKLSIPAEPDGFWYNSERGKANSVCIEAFFDPVCPDSRDSWPPLREAIKHYGSRVALVVHTFPLPSTSFPKLFSPRHQGLNLEEHTECQSTGFESYHDNAFVSSRALHIVDKLNSSATYNLLEAFFEHQEKFYGRATSNLSRASIENQISKFASETVGISYSSSIRQGFIDYKTNQATRISFKYGCIKGVYGTPFFFVNGFPLPDAGSAIDYNGWKRIIGPLIKEQGTERQGSLHFFR